MRFYAHVYRSFVFHTCPFFPSYEDIFIHCYTRDTLSVHQGSWVQNIGSDNGLMASGNKPLLEPMLVSYHLGSYLKSHLIKYMHLKDPWCATWAGSRSVQWPPRSKLVASLDCFTSGEAPRPTHGTLWSRTMKPRRMPRTWGFSIYPCVCEQRSKYNCIRGNV